MKILLTLILFISGAIAENYNWKPGIHKDIPGISDPKRTISLYLPKQYDSKKALPVLWLSSPSGNPELEYTKWADEHGIIIIGINTSRNGPSTNNIEAQNEALETINKLSLKYNTQLSIAQGFSGGAQSSWLFALRYPKNFLGVVMCGQGGHPQLLKKHIAVAFIRGENEAMTWLIDENSEKLKKQKNKVRVTIIPGDHVAGSKKLREEMLSWVFYTGVFTKPSLNDESKEYVSQLIDDRIYKIDHIAGLDEKLDAYKKLYELLSNSKDLKRVSECLEKYMNTVYEVALSKKDEKEKHELLIEIYENKESSKFRELKGRAYQELRILWKDPEIYKEYNAYKNLLKIKDYDTDRRRAKPRDKERIKKKYEAFIKKYEGLRVVQKAKEFMKGL